MCENLTAVEIAERFKYLPPITIGMLSEYMNRLNKLYTADYVAETAKFLELLEPSTILE